MSSRTVHRPARSASRRLAQGVAFPALLALVCSLLLSAAAAAAETDPAPVEEPAPGPRVVDVSKPGSKSAVVRNLRRALQAADEGRRIPSDATPRYDRLTEGIRDLPGRCTASPGESRHRICARGDRDGAITVAVFGNSHVAMWLPGLEREASRLGVRIEPFIKYGCTPYRFQMYRDGRAWRECSQWREWALGRLGDRKPDLVVVGSHTWLVMGDEAGRPIEGGATWDRKWRSGVRRTAGYLSRRIDQVVILGDTTTRASRPAKCAQSRGATMRSCEQRLTAKTRHLLKITRESAVQGGAQFLDLNAFTCYRGRCPIVSRKVFVFRDHKGHLTAPYGQAAAAAFARAIGLRAAA